MLTPEQKDVALFCGRVSGREKNKLEGVKVEFLEGGLPFVKNAAAYLACELRDSFEVTDHVLFVGEVVLAGLFPKKRCAMAGKRFPEFKRRPLLPEKQGEPPALRAAKADDQAVKSRAFLKSGAKARLLVCVRQDSAI